MTLRETVVSANNAKNLQPPFPRCARPEVNSIKYLRGKATDAIRSPNAKFNRRVSVVPTWLTDDDKRTIITNRFLL